MHPQHPQRPRPTSGGSPLLSRVSLLAVVLLFVVVVAGAVVKATGSGMGCPDWPKCFGRLIPPTQTADIPPEFMADFLDPAKGNGNLAHTWTEYVNRLFGALSGTGVLATLVLSLGLLRKRPFIPVILLAGCITFGFVAWLGKVLVDTTLAPHKITLHFLGGMILTLTMVCVAAILRPMPPAAVSRRLRQHLWIALGLTTVQMLLGTQVREIVDGLAAGQCCDGRLEEHLGGWLLWHRLGAALAVLAVASLYFHLRMGGLAHSAPILTRLVPIILALEYAAGVAMIRFQLPGGAQPVHTVLGVGLISVLVALLGRTRRESVAPADPALPAAIS
ncbi:MAG: COX15/CtaA family protein [Verrucomicrobiales bacterium]|nr:COX15/CtaA family protein [Verrucomicrobiales bacterium]